MSPVSVLVSSRRLLQVSSPLNSSSNGNSLFPNDQPTPVLISVVVVLVTLAAIGILVLISKKLVDSFQLAGVDEPQITRQDHAAAAATTLTAKQLERAKLVIFPGEDRPRGVAMPSDLVRGEGDLAAKSEVGWPVEGLKSIDTTARIEEPVSTDHYTDENPVSGLAEP